jgi:hypothetical protein
MAMDRPSKKIVVVSQHRQGTRNNKSHNKMNPRAIVRSIVGLVLLTIIVIVIIVINNNVYSAKILQLRKAASHTCSATLTFLHQDSSSVLSKEDDVANSDAEFIDASSLNSDRYKGIQVLWQKNMKLDNKGNEELCARDSSVPNGDPKVVEGFIQYVEDNEIELDSLLSLNKEYLNRDGKDVFVDSLSVSLAEEIKEHDKIWDRVIENTKRYMENWKGYNINL